MDTTRAIYKPPIHEHPLLPSARFVLAECLGCHVRGLIYGGYHCNETYCSVRIHKECAEAPLEINHPYHPEHPLLLITNESEDGPCDFCGTKLLSPYYSCPTCEFKLDFICGIKPPPPTIDHPVCHDHPLVFLKKRGEEEEVPCEVCKESIGGRPSYACLKCEVYFHVDCVHLSKEVNHPCHSNHPLKITAAESLTDDDADKTCNVCRLQPEYVLYHCSVCNFTMCLGCTRDPPPLIIQHTKTHTHPLTYVSSKIKFTCKDCGTHDSQLMPFICLTCGFVLHGSCIGLPQVININRHDHRISFTHHLGHGRIKCGVCRKSVSHYYGAYSCSVCPNYAVHSRCATHSDVWDGKELEGTPEIIEDIAPFKVVGDNLITHFSHKDHTLRFNKDNFIYDESTRCEACVHPVGFDPIYSCVKCCFFLHEKCANLPRKKRLVCYPAPFTLKGVSGLVDCAMCKEYSNGFKYIPLRGRNVDVHCGSLSEPFVHGGHLHPLFFYNAKDIRCDACKREVFGFVLGCKACSFGLCVYCASLPQKLPHSSDQHPLILYCGEKISGENWCSICEKEIDQSGWFFTCSDCEVTFHIRCVLGDFSRLMPGSIIDIEKKDFKVLLNNRNTRPLCSQCHSRCKVSIILKDCGEAEDNGYICSRLCLNEKLST